jgi:phage tail sheath protein FI
MSPNANVQALNAAFDQIDAATTQAATAQSAIAARIQGFIDAAAAAATPAETQALLDKATAEVAKLQPVADALTAMGTDPGNPVPVPVPQP